MPFTPLNVSLTHKAISEDVGNLEAFGSEFGKGIARGFLNVGEGLLGTAEWLIPGKQESLIEAKERIEATEQKFAPEYDNFAGWAGRVIGEALPYMGAALTGGYAGAAVAGGIGAGFGSASVAFSVEGQQAYDDAIEGGASHIEASAERLIVGTINAAIEAAQITRLMKFHKTGSTSLKGFIRNVRNRSWDLVKGDAKKFTGDVLKTALEEGLEEAAQEGVSISIPAFLRDDIRKKPDGSVDWSYVLNRVGGAFVGGAFAGGILGGAGALVGASPEIGRPTDADIDATIEKINKMDIPAEEKALWKQRLEEYRIEQKEETTEDIEKAPKTETQAYNKAWDEDLINTVNEIDTSLREEHLEKIRVEKGKRINTVKEVLKDKTINPRIRFRVARPHLEGDLGLRFDPIKFDEKQMEYYYLRILTSPDLNLFEKLAAEDGLNALFGTYKDSKGNAKLPEPNQIKQLEKVFGPDLASSLKKLRGENRRVSNKIIEALNFPRAILASFDVSAGGRQGLMLFPIAPKQWLKAVGRGYRAWLSPEYANYREIQIKSHPLYSLFKKHKGFLSQPGGITTGEEIFASKLAKKIPGIKASERAYSTTLNELRFGTFVKYAQQWQGTGKSEVDYDRLVAFINHATGRGDIKGLEEYAPFLNAAFFAPRLQMGRIQSVTDLFKGLGGEIKKGEFSATRKIIAKDLISFFAGGVGILWLLSHMKGVDVEHDPRSSDFGKIRFGNTRIDFWGGYSQMARLVGQLAMAETKGTDSGRIMKANRGDIVWRFIQTKLSPAAGFSVDMLRGETFLGKQLELSPEVVNSQIYERFTPLFIQDVVDALNYQGLISAAIVSPLALHGIGAMTYPKSPSSEAIQLKDTLSRRTFGRSWDDIGAIGQKYLRESNAEIELMERKAHLEREDFGSVAKRLEEQRNVMNKIMDSMPSNIRDDFEKLNVYVPGLSRSISGGWYLNDKRYKEYQNVLKKDMRLYLTRLKTSPIYNNAPDEMKPLLIEEVIKALKQKAREQILQTATFEDLEKLK